jgi:hypothetical protein
VTVHGIDVAKYQADDYATNGLDFAFVKATEGHSYINPRHGAQVATARAAGLVVGHYHFARAGSMSAQADYFLAHAGAKPGDILAFDWEDTAVSGAEKDAWLRHAMAKAPGHRTVLYANRDFWLHRDRTSFAGSGLWIADPSAPKGHPRVEHPWLFHQYSEAGGLDRDLGNFADHAALRAWAQMEDDMTPEQAAQLAQLEKDVRALAGQLRTVLSRLSVSPWQYQNTAAGDKHDMHQSLRAAEDAAAEALAQSRQNGAGLTQLKTALDALQLGGVDVDAVAKRVAALMPRVPTAQEIADVLAERLQS